MKSDKKPKIRFKGFNDEWEKRKLGDVGTFTSSGVDKLSKPNQVYVNLLNYMDVYNRNRITSKNCTDLMRVTAKPNQIKNNNILSGDVFFTPSSETVEDIGRVMVIEENLENTVYSYHLMRYRPNKNMFYLTYPNYGFDTNELHKQMSFKAKGVQRYVISKQDFENLFVTSPKYEEQSKITNLFTNLDNIITLQQHKYDKLINIKKSSFEKMFPKEGETVPKIRFKGFDDEWKKCKFEDVFKLSQGLQIPISERFTEAGNNRYFYITNEFLKDDCEKSYYIESPPDTFLCNVHDILMTRTGNTGIVVTDVEGCYHNNFFKIKYDKENFSKKYICYLLSSPDMKKTILNSAGSSTIPDLSHKSFYKIDGKFPSYVEQQKIGNYFEKLDNLINLQQQKVEKLKNIKKALLEKMFI